MARMRLARFLARAGIAARRKCEDFIRAGRVLVNGEPGMLTSMVDPVADKILLDGRPVREERKVYFVFNKPKGVIVSMGGDDRGRRTMLDVITMKERVFPVGRLDKDSEGLLFLTNDGDFAHRVLHPSFELEKEYEIVLNVAIDDKRRAKLERGLPIDGRPVKAKLAKTGERKLRIIIHEGRKHIVKRLFARLGYRVLRLRRVRIGPVRLTSLEKGAYRPLTKAEIESFG